jgi:hypothetical protein
METHNPLRGWSSHFKSKKGVFNRQLSQKYKSMDQILPFSDIFEQKSSILKKVKSDGWLVQSETCLHN